MVINIIASTGKGKTKTALDIAANLDVINQKKTVFLTNDRDFSGWIPYVESIVGKENISCFRPMYAKDLESALQIAPYVDHLPYDSIILDGFSMEFAKLSNKEKNQFIKILESYTKNRNGKIIMTIQANDTQVI